MPTLADRLKKLEQQNSAVAHEDYQKAVDALTRCAAYKIGESIAQLAGMPWDVEVPELPNERAATAICRNAGDMEEARNKLVRRLRGLSIPMLFYQCRQVYTGVALPSDVVDYLATHGPLARMAAADNVKEPMDEGTADSFLALLTEAEIVALAWCWAFYARPNQVLPR